MKTEHAHTFPLSYACLVLKLRASQVSAETEGDGPRTNQKSADTALSPWSLQTRCRPSAQGTHSHFCPWCSSQWCLGKGKFLRTLSFQLRRSSKAAMRLRQEAQGKRRGVKRQLRSLQRAGNCQISLQLTESLVCLFSVSAYVAECRGRFFDSQCPW